MSYPFDDQDILAEEIEANPDVLNGDPDFERDVKMDLEATVPVEVDNFDEPVEGSPDPGDEMWEDLSPEDRAARLDEIFAEAAEVNVENQRLIEEVMRLSGGGGINPVGLALMRLDVMVAMMPAETRATYELSLARTMLETLSGLIVQINREKLTQGISMNGMKVGQGPAVHPSQPGFQPGVTPFPRFN